MKSSEKNEQIFTIKFTENGQNLICGYGKEYTAGYSKDAEYLLGRLNDSFRPNISQIEENVIEVCFNWHEKGDDCEYEIFNLNIIEGDY